jgi:hypothetical protein
MNDEKMTSKRQNNIWKADEVPKEMTRAASKAKHQRILNFCLCGFLVILLLRPSSSRTNLKFQLTFGPLSPYLDKLGHVVAVRSVAVEDSKQQAPVITDSKCISVPSPPVQRTLGANKVQWKSPSRSSCRSR